MHFIDPKIDFAFKKIFGSEDTKEILISFLESLLGLTGEKRLKRVTLLDPFQAPKIHAMKYSILDVKCVDHRGVQYVVEMQIHKVRAFLKRIQYNAAKAYVNQIAKAEAYPKLNQIIAITITDFILFDAFEHSVSRHVLREDRSQVRFLDAITYYFIELPKFKKGLHQLESALDRWIYFIKWADSYQEPPVELNEAPWRHAFEKARVVNMNQEEFEFYEQAGIALADQRGAIELAMAEGEARGEAWGEARGIIKGGTQLLLLLLQKRFGSLPEWSMAKLELATQEEVELWSERILNAACLEDVFK
ncbi:Rpn family recombination-promoting nuclease/putative transposase [Magnetococcales bacterium HHB-1]